ncbi:MAG: substrate-binding domain-containing protein [Lentisphaerae bacterium]|nr:substrate-binding domain-containing protein [Lentisphaerota bacterium]
MNVCIFKTIEVSSVKTSFKIASAAQVDPVDMADDLAEWSESVAAAERLVKEKQVTAFACASETAGWRLCRHFEECGISVPGDVAVTGVHRSTAGSMVNKYDLTTILASYEAIGAAALRRLLFRIQNPAETRRNILFPCTLHLGSTT